MAPTAATLAPSPAFVTAASPTPAPTLANVAYEKKGAVAYVTVNRPKVLNARRPGRICERRSRTRVTTMPCAASS
jgi:1,4-dihydroxy-2-naphthoyl-CoA synthase